MEENVSGCFFLNTVYINSETSLYRTRLTQNYCYIDVYRCRLPARPDIMVINTRHPPATPARLFRPCTAISRAANFAYIELHEWRVTYKLQPYSGYSCWGLEERHTAGRGWARLSVSRWCYAVHVSHSHPPPVHSRGQATNWCNLAAGATGSVMWNRSGPIDSPALEPPKPVSERQRLRANIIPRNIWKRKLHMLSGNQIQRNRVIDNSNSCPIKDPNHRLHFEKHSRNIGWGTPFRRAAIPKRRHCQGLSPQMAQKPD